MATAWRVSNRGLDVAAPLNSSKPKLALGCRWGGTEAERVVLFPEGAMRVQGTGRQILELCDGELTFEELVAHLQHQYSPSDDQRIREDAARFLEQLHDKRIVDY
jgi:coenzyme PQQ biosynthesis protein PqqD